MSEEAVAASEWDAAYFKNRADWEGRLGVPLARVHGLQIAGSAFNPMSAGVPASLRKPQDVANRKTCESTAHSGQVGFEVAIGALVVDGAGKFASLDPVTQSWKAVFVPTLHELKRSSPCALFQKSTSKLLLPLTMLAKRCLVCLPLVWHLVSQIVSECKSN